MADLVLPLKRQYFEEIRDGLKPEEYRLCNAYWTKRLAKDFDRVILTLGYPRRDDHARRLVLPYRGFTVKTITHPHFGTEPVQVFAIDVSSEAVHG